MSHRVHVSSVTLGLRGPPGTAEGGGRGRSRGGDGGGLGHHDPYPSRVPTEGGRVTEGRLPEGRGGIPVRKKRPKFVRCYWKIKDKQGWRGRKVEDKKDGRRKN